MIVKLLLLLLLLLLDVKLWQASRGGIGDPEAGCAHEV